MTVKVLNDGPGPVTFDHLTVRTVRGAPGTFTELPNFFTALLCDGTLKTLLPQTACLLFVQFTPASPGHKRGRLEIVFTDGSGGRRHDGDEEESDHDGGHSTIQLDVSLRGDGVSTA
jgi:hypothetical protein